MLVSSANLAQPEISLVSYFGLEASEKLPLIFRLFEVISLFWIPMVFVIVDLVVALLIQFDEKNTQKEEWVLSLVIGWLSDMWNIYFSEPSTDKTAADKLKVTKWELFSSFSWHSCLGDKYREIVDNKLFNLIISIFVLLEIFVCVFSLHSYIYNLFIDVEYRRSQLVADCLKIGIFDAQYLCRKANLLPLNRVDSDLKHAFYIKKTKDFILSLSMFIIYHCAMSIVGRIIKISSSKEIDLYDKNGASLPDKGKYRTVGFIIGMIAPLLFAIVVVLTVSLLDYICENPNSVFVDVSYGEKLIQYNGPIVSKLDTFNQKKRDMCADYLGGNRSFSEVSVADIEKMSEEALGKYESRRTVAPPMKDMMVRIGFIIGLSIVGLGLMLLVEQDTWSVRRGHMIKKDTEWSRALLLLLFTFFVLSFIVWKNFSSVYNMFVSSYHIIYNDIHYMINAKSNDPDIFMRDIQIAMNIKERRILYQCIPMVEKADDKIFKLPVSASLFRGFKDRYPDSDGKFNLKPVALKTMLIQYLREGNTEKALNMVNVLSGLQFATDALKDLCTRIKTSIINSRVLLNDINFLLDQKNGIFVNLLKDVLSGCDITDDGLLLSKVMSEFEVKEVKSKWFDMTGEDPKFEAPSKYLTDDLVSFRLYGKSWSSLTDAEKFKCVAARQKLENGKKKSFVFIVRSPCVVPFTYDQSFHAFSGGREIKVPRNDDIGYEKPSKVPRGFIIPVSGGNGSGKTVSMSAFLGSTSSTSVTVTRSMPLNCSNEAAVVLGKKSLEEISADSGIFEFVPLSLINSDQRNFFLHTISVGDLIDLPGATFKESMDAGLSTHLDYVEVCLKSVIKLIDNSKSFATDRDIGSAIGALWSAHSVLCSRDKNGNPARDADISRSISDIVSIIAADLRLNSKAVSISKHLKSLTALLKLVQDRNRVLTSRIQRDAYELREGMAQALSLNMPDGNELIWYFSTGENAKSCIINTCVNLVIKGLNASGKAQNICLNDEALANVDKESVAVISSWFSRPLASFGITKIEIAHHSSDFSSDSPDIMMFFDAKLKSVLFYYRKNGRWWSEVEFIRVGSGEFQIFYLDNGAELIVAEVSNDFELSQKSVHELFSKWSKERPEFKDMMNVTEAELFIRNTIGLDPDVIVREFNFLPVEARIAVLNAFYNAGELWYLLSVLGYEYEITTDQDGRKVLADDPKLRLLDARSREMLESYIIPESDNALSVDSDDNAFSVDYDKDGESTDADQSEIETEEYYYEDEDGSFVESEL
jgi:hypothetical protein